MGEDKFEIYQDKTEEWRWRLTATNGEIIAASTEGYTDKRDCISNAYRIGILTDGEEE